MVLIRGGKGGGGEEREREREIIGGDHHHHHQLQKGMRLGKYEIGRTLGEGNFGKVKYAKNLDSGQSFAIKILEKNRILDLNITDQIKREIGTLKLLKHPNVVRLYEVLASKTKIYMVLEYVNGGELFDRIASKGRLSESAGRKLFQQLIDGVSYCHNRGVFHRDLKLENVLVDAKGNIKITDFGLSALPQHFGDDGLLHTTCGSPNYVAPEILSTRGYDGATADTWSCGVILYVILTGHLPFDDRNLAVLYQKIFKGDAQIPKWLSPGAQNLIRRILNPDPRTRITMSDIKQDEWFKQGYSPACPDEEEEEEVEEEEDEGTFTEDQVLTVHDAVRTWSFHYFYILYGFLAFYSLVFILLHAWKINLYTSVAQQQQQPSPLQQHPSEAEKDPDSPTLINAFQLIGMSSCLDLSGFFEKEDVSERKIRFTSHHSPKELLERIHSTVTEMGFCVQKKNGKLKATQWHRGQRSPGSLSVAAQVFEISPSLYVVELRKYYGDATIYRQLCNKLAGDLGVSQRQGIIAANC